MSEDNFNGSTFIGRKIKSLLSKDLAGINFIQICNEIGIEDCEVTIV